MGLFLLKVKKKSEKKSLKKSKSAFYLAEYQTSFMLHHIHIQQCKTWNQMENPERSLTDVQFIRN